MITFFSTVLAGISIFFASPVNVEDRPVVAEVLTTVGFQGSATDGCECLYVPAPLAVLIG
jgi:hypothetical protein